ncbi:4-hydroxy-tetrahydrodipicolinate reductase [Cupriavidus agavae]|uniref:4-hydroxy-tetrahydrodipicolinate reductase n=1 Tax=Cupriavidus agavae TaxID=1001822 RepID=A0A4Q7S3S7_9BURK|nr:4-hydroxy-tetrahydrodipicolinate reductase [Cupriavidus agavae]RZT41134.1 dihydrodipicolinate reductase [Cupriavidus agavae]
MKIAIAGASGRMGRMLIETVLNTEGVTLAGALDIPGSPALGQDAAMFLGRETGVKISSDIDAVMAASDCLIDFTRPEGTLAHLAVAQRLGKKIVVGTTGFDAAGKQALDDAAKSIGVVFASNFSVGVNATFKLLEVAAKLLSSGYDIEVIEAHHRHKVDAPSGTALTMGEVIAKAIGRNLDDCAVYAREGHTGPRDPNSIGFATIRGGDIVGDHTVMFAGIGERIEISHKSSSRQSYADGAVRAARFLADKPSGLFDMQDVLGLK